MPATHPEFPHPVCTLTPRVSLHAVVNVEFRTLGV